MITLCISVEQYLNYPNLTLLSILIAQTVNRSIDNNAFVTLTSVNLKAL